MRGTFCIAAILLAGQPVAPESSPEQDGPPDPEFLEFLGETADFNPEIIGFMDSREAKRAMRAAGTDRAGDVPAEGVDWNSLDASVQALLAGQKPLWNSLPAERQRMLAAGAARSLAMSDTDHAAAQARFQTWREMPAADREWQRERWKRLRELTPEQQEALREAYRRFLELPPERREAVLERWEAMSPEERRRAIQRRQGPKPGSVDRRPCPPC